jgi:hypothetical protein
MKEIIILHAWRQMGIHIHGLGVHDTIQMLAQSKIVEKGIVLGVGSFLILFIGQDRVGKPESLIPAFL